MNVLVVGGGGREHALAWRIGQSPLVDQLVVTDPNPGFPDDAVHASGDLAEVADQYSVGLVVIGPEAPLADGVSDQLRKAGFPVFGPSQAAAQLESSKSFAKTFMDHHRIPTARWSVHEDAQSAHDAVVGPCVVKADGLAAGKGVFVAEDATVAHEAIDSIFAGAFGQAGHRVVVEELLSGPEVSVLAICDGRRAIAMQPCRDHKRRFDGDGGPNTGGMGAVCPAPGLDAGFLQEVEETILQPVVDGMAADGMPFHGVLYAGLMLTPDGPKVLEFNVRFGDPECQPLMLMLDEDIVPWMLASAVGDLPDRSMKWRDGAACCVVMVSGGYPGPIEKGKPIRDVPAPTKDTVVFFAGARRQGGEIQTSGGRVLGVTSYGNDLETARTLAYEQVNRITFETASWRTDIGE